MKFQQTPVWATGKAHDLWERGPCGRKAEKTNAPDVLGAGNYAPRTSELCAGLSTITRDFSGYCWPVSMRLGRALWRSEMRSPRPGPAFKK
ncbi:hypothetical protein A0H81_12071 [Grifola frondosa]|uniref:Uncharacterized protein n=1 Tax=Grifola frondosa TaxID=5627 RepID=A0A1C7LS22_GRIFR|nr:hypothetical protein A0H81_12071 [Grifola frondosa]